MSGRWWRAYSRARHDPKLLKLSDRQFRWWFNFVSVAADNDGLLPSHADLAVEFRASGKLVTEMLDALIAAELLDHDETGIRPHNWNGLQFKSDVSNERVKRHRERSRNVTGNNNVTPSETESESETDTEAKAASGADAPSEDIGIAFDEFTKAASECGWPKPRGLEPDRRKKLKARLDEHGLEGWRQVLANARASEFIRSKFPLKLDWVLEPRNFRKVLEGNYGACASDAGPSAPSTDEILWEARFRNYHPGGMWQEATWGPRPESGRCHAPPPVLERWRGRVAQ